MNEGRSPRKAAKTSLAAFPPPRDGARGEAHGTLDVSQRVHALQMSDCGEGDEERLHLEF